MASPDTSFSINRSPEQRSIKEDLALRMGVIAIVAGAFILAETTTSEEIACPSPETAISNTVECN